MTDDNFGNRLADEKVENLIREVPNVSSAWDACNGKGFLEMVNDRLQEFPSTLSGYDGVAESYTKSLNSLLIEYPDALETIPNFAVAELIDRSYGDKYVDSQLMAKLFSSYEPQWNAGYQWWNADKLSSLSGSLTRDEMIEEAALNWENLSIEERMTVGQRIQDIQSDIFGVPRTPLVASDLSGFLGRSEWIESLPETVQKWVPDEWTQERDGEYDSEDKELKIDNSWGGPLYGGNFKEFVKTVLHEGEHAFHDGLIDKLTKIRTEEDRWFAEQKIYTLPMSAEHTEQYKNHMAEWLKHTYPKKDSSDPFVDVSLLLTGGLREFAMAMQAGLSLDPENNIADITPEEKYEIYRANPSENAAWSIERVVDGVYGGERRKFLQELKDEFAEIGKENTQNFFQIKRDIGDVRFGGNPRIESVCRNMPEPVKPF